MLNGIWRDLLHAGQSLAKARAFTFVCVVSLGIGMAPIIAVPYGARVFETPPAGLNTDGLVEIVRTQAGPVDTPTGWSYPDFVDLRDADTGIAVIGWIGGQSEVTFSGEDLRAATLYVSSGYFSNLGLALAQGPGFDASMHDPLNAQPAVILGYDFWQNRLSAAPDIVGKTLTLDNIPYLVVGIAPELFQGHQFEGRELFIPLERHPDFVSDDNVRFDRSHAWINLHGRLPSGVGIAQASAAVSVVTSELARQYPSTNEFTSGTVEPYHPLGALMRDRILIIEAAVATFPSLVLLVVCLNLGGMMQVRSAIRERELSIRQAIGANRRQMVQHLISESIILATLGGTLASLVLFNLPSVISWLVDQPIPARFRDALRLDLPMVAICVGLCLVTSLVLGLLPATRFSRPVIITALKDDAGGGGFRVGRVHRITAALQVAIAVPLLVIGVISLDRVRSTAMSELGFESDLLYAAPLNLKALTDVASVADAQFRIRSVRDHVRSADGVASVTVADGLPLDFQGRVTSVALDVEADTAPDFIGAHVTRIGDGYLDTMGIPLLGGRAFDADDSAGAARVTIISAALASRLFLRNDAGRASTDVIGRQLIFGTEEATEQTLTIVGVTGDFPTSQMSNPREQLLLPLAQHPDADWNEVPAVDDFERGRQIMLIARSVPGEQPAKLNTTLVNAVQEIDPEFGRERIVTGISLRENSMNDFLTWSMVAGVPGGVILILAALGIYGVVGLMVATRTREIAVRVALGATRRRLVGMILFDVVKLATPGIIAGLILTAAIMRLNAENMGIALSNVEYLSYLVGAAIAVLVAVLAGFLPARSAASVQPMVAMRTQ